MKWAEEGELLLRPRSYAGHGDLRGQFLVYAATNKTELNEQVCLDAEGLDLLYNASDRSEQSSFMDAAVIRRGPLVLTVSTSGTSPSAAKAIKGQLDQQFTGIWEEALTFVGEWRERVQGEIIDSKERQALFKQSFAPHQMQLLQAGQLEVWKEELTRSYTQYIEQEAFKVRKIIVGSRQSALALTQTGQVIDQLKLLSAANGIDCEFEIKKIVTKGDQILDVTLSKVGGKGLFVKEIEQALLDGDIDMAVHSMKDMPWELPEGLTNGAVPKRVDARDCIISRNQLTLKDLPHGAKVGTSSLRRASQLKQYRPDLQLEPIRGNIDSRIKKLETEGFDAIILAAAGLYRMGWQDRITEYLPVELCLPAVGQGSLGIECRENDPFMLQLLGLLNDADSELTVAAERTFLRLLNGGCQIPIGAYATWKQDVNDAGAAPLMELTGFVGSTDGTEWIKETYTGTDPVLLGEEVARRCIAKGADRILAEVRG
jgi:hydroxymethylbilane synthase